MCFDSRMNLKMLMVSTPVVCFITVWSPAVYAVFFLALGQILFSIKLIIFKIYLSKTFPEIYFQIHLFNISSIKLVFIYLSICYYTTLHYHSPCEIDIDSIALSKIRKSIMNSYTHFCSTLRRNILVSM